MRQQEYEIIVTMVQHWTNFGIKQMGLFKMVRCIWKSDLILIHFIFVILIHFLDSTVVHQVGLQPHSVQSSILNFGENV